MLQHFSSLFVQIAQMGLILSRWGVSLCPEYHSKPLFFTQQSRGYVRTQNTPNPSQNTPFPGLNLKVGKLNYHLGNLDPNWAICLKSGQNFPRGGQKKLFIIWVTIFSNNCIVQAQSNAIFRSIWSCRNDSPNLAMSRRTLKMMQWLHPALQHVSRMLLVFLVFTECTILHLKLN